MTARLPGLTQCQDLITPVPGGRAPQDEEADPDADDRLQSDPVVLVSRHLL